MAYILYTPASMQLLMCPNDDDDRPDLTKMLITVIPPMATAHLMTMDTIIAQEHMEQGHYTTHGLRFDAMLLAHNCAQHPSLAQTLRNVAAVGWWPGVKEDIACVHYAYPSAEPTGPQGSVSWQRRDSRHYRWISKYWMATSLRPVAYRQY